MKAASSSSNFVKLIPILLALPACSLHYTTADGVNRHFGLLVVDSTDGKCQLLQSVDSVGLTLDLTKESGGLNIGRRKITTTSIKSDSLMSLEDAGEGAIYPLEYNIALQMDRPKSTLLACP